jgi:hypothetical protein
VNSLVPGLQTISIALFVPPFCLSTGCGLAGLSDGGIPNYVKISTFWAFTIFRAGKSEFCGMRRIPFGNRAVVCSVQAVKGSKALISQADSCTGRSGWGQVLLLDFEQAKAVTLI